MSALGQKRTSLENYRFKTRDAGSAFSLRLAKVPCILLVSVPLLALLVLSVWFAGAAWEHIGGEPIPAYGYVAIVGGVFVSLLVGGGLMALVFYSSRHGYDDLSGGDK